MKFESLVLVILLCGSLFSPQVIAQGGVSGRITDLTGHAREGLKFKYTVRGRDVASNERYVMVYPTPSITTLGTGSDIGGTFEITIPDGKFNQGTKEVFITLESEGKQAVELSYLLGTAQHEVSVVMRDGRYRTRTILAHKATYQSPKGDFHLVGGDATAFFKDPKTRLPQLEYLRFQKLDDNFLYYRTNNPNGNDWAFAINPQTLYVGCSGGWEQTERYRIWRRDIGTGRWRGFAFSKRILLSTTARTQVTSESHK